MNDQQLNLQERLVRYNAKALADEKTAFCSHKQQLDWALLQGKKPDDLMKLSSPVRGQPSFFDPLNSQLAHVIDRRKEIDEELDQQYKAKDFQDSIAEIPKVAYHPATLLTQMQKNKVSLKSIGRIAKTKPDVWTEEDFFSPEKGESVGSNSVSVNSKIRQSTLGTSSSPQYDSVGNVLPEASLQLAMLKAKSGDKRSLYNLFMAADPSYEPVMSSDVNNMRLEGSVEGSLANSDFNYTNIEGENSILGLIEEKSSAIQQDENEASLELAQLSEQDKNDAAVKILSPPRSALEMAASPPDSANRPQSAAILSLPGSAPHDAVVDEDVLGQDASRPQSVHGSRTGSSQSDRNLVEGNSRPITSETTTPIAESKLIESQLEEEAVVEVVQDKEDDTNNNVEHAVYEDEGKASEEKTDSKLDTPPGSAPNLAEFKDEEKNADTKDEAPPVPELNVNVVEEQQNLSEVSPEITSAFFSSEGKECDFTAMTLDDVNDDASIDKEGARVESNRSIRK